jgi:hypothetical protein
MKECTSRLYSSGLSRLGKCPASGMRTRSARGSVRRSSSPIRAAGACPRRRSAPAQERRSTPAPRSDAGRLWSCEQIVRGIAPGHERQQLVHGALVGPQRGKRMPLPLPDCVDAPCPRQLAIPRQRHLWLAGSLPSNGAPSRTRHAIRPRSGPAAACIAPRAPATSRRSPPAADSAAAATFDVAPCRPRAMATRSTVRSPAGHNGAPASARPTPRPAVATCRGPAPSRERAAPGIPAPHRAAAISRHRPR